MDINRASEETANRIAIAFSRSGVSKKKLAESTGIPYATLDRRFRVGGGYTVREAIALAAAFGVPVTNFFVEDPAREAAA
ncbi:transcriptional regulator with XRE-family HTH domain [Microbacterium resistens]|uniref:Transcriptional regulator with XRE-family HTH domain n=1 Tax=Microbacterium resistens TaxID=156977 RepID=A0ABU1SHB6_9MICO|nr:hypothetical protein [Microbacterium resistens]MDR6868937.1 transcriptional regulator with XRE-family HTH domain [Microbacterium resistens]